MHESAEITVVVVTAIALIAGAATRRFSQRTRFPYTIAMLLIGLLVGALLRFFGEATAMTALLQRGSAVSADLIIFVFLPALVFESAFALDAYAFRRNVGAATLLAGPALVVSTGLTAAVMVGLTRLAGADWSWGWLTALVFGALISATDPVAVVAILKEQRAPRRLGVLIEGESLLNDGTAIVLFTLLVGILTTDTTLTGGGVLLDFVRTVIGGVVVGLLLAWVVTMWLSRTFNDALVEITLTIVLAYAAMIVAEGMLHVSGVMAVVTAGLWMSSRGRTRISPEVTHFLHQFWELLAYIANTLIFYLVGVIIVTQLGGARLRDFVLIAGGWVAIVAIRAAVTFLFKPLFRFVGDPVDRREASMIAWGGLRGAVSLALALVVSQHPEIPDRLGSQILLLTAGVVFLTILVNGSSTGWMLRWFGFDRVPPGERLVQQGALASAVESVRETIERLQRGRDLRTVSWDEVHDDLTARREQLLREIEAARRDLHESGEGELNRGLWRQALAVERQSYWTAFAQGTLGANALQILDHEIDMQLDRLNHADMRAPDTRTPERVIQGPSFLSRLIRRARDLSVVRFGKLSLLYDLSRAELMAADAVLDEIDDLQSPDRIAARDVAAVYERYRLTAKERIEDLRANLPELTRAIETRLARRIQLNVERDLYDEMIESGRLDERTGEAALASVEERMKHLFRAARHVAIPPLGQLCSNTDLFRSLSTDASDDLVAAAREVVLAPGEILFREGERGDSLFVIARGAVRVVKSIDGRDHVLDVLGGGDILGEMALLTGEPRIASAVAATAVTLGRIDRRDFETIVARHPELRGQVWQNFTERSFDDYLLEHGLHPELSKAERIAWVRGGSGSSLAPGEPLVEEERSIFILAGSVELGGAVRSAPLLIERRGEAGVAKTAVRLVRLPPLESVRLS